MDVDYLIRETRLLKYPVTPVKSHVIGAQHGLMATCMTLVLCLQIAWLALHLPLFTIASRCVSRVRNVLTDAQYHPRRIIKNINLPVISQKTINYRRRTDKIPDVDL